MTPKILFVDTDRSFLTHLSSRLRQHDIQVVEQLGVNGVEDQLRARPIGIVVIDMERIKGEGIVLIKSIKNTFPRTEIILLTNAEQVSLSIEAMKIGPFEEIYLPLDIHALVKTIKQAQKRWETSSCQSGI
ncbi:response regulator [Desulfoplanes sp. PS50]|jgi:two-component system response regulator HydG